MNLYVVLGSAIVGLLVGMTGAGGGALMTPMLILLFNVKAATAISSDLVAAVAMRPFGAAVHAQRKTVNYRVVGWLAVGAAPAALFGTWLLNQMAHTEAATAGVEKALGAALLLGAAAMALRYILDRRSHNPRTGTVDSVRIRPLPTVVAGLVGGIVVGLTSVGSGSLLIVMLMFIYPSLSAKRLVGTDLTQAIPLTAAAALGALVFGHVQVPLTAAIIAGSVPAVALGSFLSSRTTDRFLRPVIFCAVLASGLKYAGLGTDDLAWGVGAAVTVIVADLLWTRARRSRTVTERESMAGRYREFSPAVANGQIAP
jgi:uncharacterized membrane protein YfcA